MTTWRRSTWDSTPNAAEAVTELKTRAEDLTDVVSDANGNSRFAVVDYKGTDAGNPYVAHVAQDFTTDPADCMPGASRFD